MRLLGVGLQLSYLGTIGIIIFNKNIRNNLDNLKFRKNNVKIRKNNKFSRIIDNLKDTLSVTLSAQIMIIPLMIYHFNMIGIYFILTNILVSVIVGPIMMLAIIFIITSFINLEISNFISIFLSIGIKLFVQIANLSELPFSKIYVATPRILSIILYYIFILIINQIYVIYTSKYINYTQKRVKNLIALCKYKINQKKRNLQKKLNKIIKEKDIKEIYLKTYKIIFIMILIIIFNCLNTNLEINFIDVGQGDACFIITPKNKTILVDGGGSTSTTFDIGEDTLLPYILDKGYVKIDYVFISHFDQDHVGGILSILENLKVGKIYITKQGESSENYKKFFEIIKQKKLKVQILEAGDRVVIDSLSFDILWPIEQKISENILNNNAMVMKLKYKNFSMLFTGDIEEVAEKAILDTYKDNLEVLKATVLKVAHHGSKTSTIQEFLEKVNPKIALIGVGENNMFGHPNSGVLERLESFRCGNF